MAVGLVSDSVPYAEYAYLIQSTDLNRCVAMTTEGESVPQFSLSEAAEAGELATVQNLLAEGADVNAADEEGWTPLMSAAAAGTGCRCKREDQLWLDGVDGGGGSGANGDR